MSDQFKGLFAQAREHVRLKPPTQAEQDEHAISWVLGNLNASTNHQTTREVVEREYYKMKAENNLCERCGLPVTSPLRYHEWFVCVREQKAKIAELQRKLGAVTAERDMAWAADSNRQDECYASGHRDAIEQYKRHFDAIAEALGQPKVEPVPIIGRQPLDVVGRLGWSGHGHTIEIPKES